MKDKSIKKLSGIIEKSYLITIVKKPLLDNRNLSRKIEAGDKYTFGVELSEDKKTVIPYLDIKKIDKNQIKFSSYISYIQFGNNKILYLEPLEVNNEYYSYEYSLPIEEMFNDKENDVEIKLYILSLSLELK